MLGHGREFRGEVPCRLARHHGHGWVRWWVLTGRVLGTGRRRPARRANPCMAGSHCNCCCCPLIQVLLCSLPPGFGMWRADDG